MRPDLDVDRYWPGDRDALYDICARTGDLGDDARPDLADPALLGHVYLGPYLELEPGLAFVVRRRGGTEPLGYVVGAADTAAFEAACEERWWPRLREHHRAYPPARSGGRDPGLLQTIEKGVRTRAPWLGRYPASLHINLLPPVRGGGGGRALMGRLLAELAARGAPGVHLGVSPANAGAVAFYRRLGFTDLEERDATRWMGRPTVDGAPDRDASDEGPTS